jgi:hypothetical protein
MDEPGGHPLPKDMRWKADDPRWDDLSVQTSWDKYIAESVKHYRGRAVVFEIENEPEFDGWGPYQAEYVKFTTRTAKLIKQTDPKALVMINNVYEFPAASMRLCWRAKAQNTSTSFRGTITTKAGFPPASRCSA